MQIQSLVRKEGELVPIEVEISLSPGLPQLQCLGLPDQHIKESTHRIRSALKNQGFEFPKGRQVLVNLRPSFGKKTSQGLELAIATGILWETGQVPKPTGQGPQLIYGELSLHGEIAEPSDLENYSGENVSEIWTGASDPLRELHFSRRTFLCLRDLAGAGIHIPASEGPSPERPSEWLDLSVSHAQAKLLSVMALGEHPSLLLGPSGSGKTTLALALNALLAEPNAVQFRKLRQRAKRYGDELSWRPLIKPHHTATVTAMVGGGAIPGAGEVARADGGILLLDEFFEFSGRALEALREPIEEGIVRVARAGHVRSFPCRSLIVATANLCPCGDWAPGKSTSCSLSLRRCQSYIERMSGPLLDRFQIMSFSHNWKSRSELRLSEVLAQLDDVRQWKRSHGRAELPNARRSAEECLSGLDDFSRQELLPSFSSRRRELSTFRIARTLADLEKVEELKMKHIEEALQWTVDPWVALKSWM